MIYLPWIAFVLAIAWMIWQCNRQSNNSSPITKEADAGSDTLPFAEAFSFPRERSFHRGEGELIRKQLWAEALRDIGVLLLVFGPLDTILQGKTQTTMHWLAILGVGISGFLILGIGIRMASKK